MAMPRLHLIKLEVNIVLRQHSYLSSALTIRDFNVFQGSTTTLPLFAPLEWEKLGYKL